MSKKFNHNLECFVINASHTELVEVKAEIHIIIELESRFRIKRGVAKRFVFTYKFIAYSTKEFYHFVFGYKESICFKL